MGRKGNKTTYPEFRALSKDEQREHILRVASMCIDACPTYFARLVEIYFDATPDEQAERQDSFWKAVNNA